jgi:hypothetical protein
MKALRFSNLLKSLPILAALMLGALAPTLRATPITISYDFTFDQNTSHPGEVPVTGNLTVTLNTPAASFTGYTADGVVDSLDFSITGLPGYQAASTNYLKMLFLSGKLSYLYVSDRSDFALQGGNGARKEGYILMLQGTDLIAGTGITVGSFGSYFDYLLPGRFGIDVAYTFDRTDIVQVPPPTAGVPDTASTLGLFGLAMLGLAAGSRRIRA